MKLYLYKTETKNQTTHQTSEQGKVRKNLVRPSRKKTLQSPTNLKTHYLNIENPSVSG